MPSELTIFLAFIAAILGLSIWWTVSARRTLRIETALPPDQTYALVERCFGMNWIREGGPGDINRRLRVVLRRGCILSVDIEATSDGSIVDIWMSGWGGALGIADYALNAVLKKSSIRRRLQQAKG